MTRMNRFTGMSLAAFSALLWLSFSVNAQVKTPPAPKTYQVELRYRIDAERNERIRQYRLMMQYLASLGFAEKETEDSATADLNPEANLLIGTIPSENARKLLSDVRIRTVLVYPQAYQFPSDDTSVRLSISLHRGLAAADQRLFHEQSVKVLKQLGLVESIAYDHQGFTLVRGLLASAAVRDLLVDLRSQPAGWFLSTTDLGVVQPPFISELPIRFIEVLPEPEGANAAVNKILPPQLKDVPEDIAKKISWDLRGELVKEGNKAATFVEIFLDPVPAGDDSTWIEQFKSAIPELRYEGRIGNIAVIGLGQVTDAVRLASAPIITHIRLPRKVTPRIAITAAPAKKEARIESNIQLTAYQQALNPLTRTRIQQLQELGYNGAGTHIVLIDTDFAGLPRFFNRGMSPSVKYIDLTAERSREILPDPEPIDGLGSGTLSALAIAKAAPAARLTLIRVNNDAPVQLETITKAVMNRTFRSESMIQRRREFDVQLIVLQQRIAAANERYRKAFDNFEDTDEARKERIDSAAELDKTRQDEREFLTKAVKLNRLEEDLLSLIGAQIVVSNLTWDTGHPMEGNSVLSQSLSTHLAKSLPFVVENVRKLPKKPLWVQAAGDTGGQTWAGRFEDRDGNGIMEFVPHGMPLPDRWTTETNFLCLETNNEGNSDLPKDRKLRFALQWREPHSEDFPIAEYREPIAKFKMQLLYQRDPDGKLLPSDEMNVVAESDGAGTLLYSEKHFGIYEQTIEVNLPSTGRYAVRVEGKLPQFRVPTTVFGLPSMAEPIEISPRLAIESIDAEPQPGRIIFGDYRVAGGVGMPADSRAVLTIGAASLDMKTRLLTSRGSGPSTQLLAKPDLWAFDQLPIGGGDYQTEMGTSTAAGFTAGIIATAHSAGGSVNYFMSSLGLQPGHLLEIPEAWLQTRSRK